MEEQSNSLLRGYKREKMCGGKPPPRKIVWIREFTAAAAEDCLDQGVYSRHRGRLFGSGSGSLNKLNCENEEAVFET